MPISNSRCNRTAVTHEDDLSDLKSIIPEVLAECSRIFQSETRSPQNKMHIAYAMQVAKGVYNS